jgi:hypothetical protein
VAKTTRGEPDFDSFADITLIVPGMKKNMYNKIKEDGVKAYKTSKQNKTSCPQINDKL